MRLRSALRTRPFHRCPGLNDGVFQREQHAEAVASTLGMTPSSSLRSLQRAGLNALPVEIFLEMVEFFRRNGASVTSGATLSDLILVC